MLRVIVEVVPFGDEALAEEIARVHVANVGDGYEQHVDNYQAHDATNGVRFGSHGTTYADFFCHRYGWYRNRLGLAAKALELLQEQRDNGNCLPDDPPYGIKPPHERPKPQARAPRLTHVPLLCVVCERPLAAKDKGRGRCRSH